MKKHIILQLILILFFTASAQSVKKFGVWTKGVSTGPSLIVRFFDDYIIMDSGRSIRLLDNSNPDDPVELDAYPSVPVLNIIVYNNLIFVFPQFQPLVRVFKINGSNQLELLRTITIEGSYIQVTHNGDNFIFLSSNKLYIYNLTNDLNLDSLSTVPVTSNEYSSLTAYNDRCIISYGAKIFLYDISNPSTPNELVEYNTGGGTIRDMKVKDNDLYLSGFKIGLRIVSLANEKNPSIVSNYYLENTFHFSLKNTYAFVWDNNLQGVDILDFSNISSPTRISQFTINANQYGEVYNYQNKLYVCDRATLNGLQVWSIDNIQSPMFLFNITSENTRYSFDNVIIYNDVAILNCGSKGIILANKSNYNQLEILAEITALPYVDSIATYSNLLLLDCGTKMLIYDIQNPASPNLQSTILFPSKINSFTVDSSKIYVAIDKQFFIYSISDPSNPSMEYESPSISPSYLNYGEVKKINNTIHLFVNDYGSEVFPITSRDYVDIYDITKPAETNMLARINSDDYPSHLYQYKGTCYGITGNKLQVYNFDDPTNVSVINTITLSKPVLYMKFSGDIGYGVCGGNTYYGWESLISLDLSNPNIPSELGVEDFDTGIMSFDENNQIFYMCWYTNGVSIYQVNDINGIKGKSSKPEVNFGNYPNPFNPTTTIDFSLKQNSRVKVTVYSLIGKKINTPLDGFMTAGNHSIIFDGTGLSSGVYFYTIEAKNTDGKIIFRDTKKMVLLK